MRRTSPAVLFFIAAAVVALVSIAMQFGGVVRRALAVATWVEWAAMLVLAAMILWLGHAVRAYQKGEKPNLDPIRAARTLALAKAGSLTGAVLLGRYGAVVMVTLADWNFGDARWILLNASVAALAALVLVVASLVAEHWCELPPNEPPDRAKRQLGLPEGSTAYLGQRREYADAQRAR